MRRYWKRLLSSSLVFCYQKQLVIFSCVAVYSANWWPARSDTEGLSMAYMKSRTSFRVGFFGTQRANGKLVRCSSLVGFRFMHSMKSTLPFFPPSLLGSFYVLCSVRGSETEFQFLAVKRSNMKLHSDFICFVSLVARKERWK